MFNRSAAQLISTRSQAKTKLSNNDENKGVNEAKSMMAGKQDGKLLMAGGRTRRRALGDVSNTNVAPQKPAPAEKPARTKISKPTAAVKRTSEVLKAPLAEKDVNIKKAKEQKVEDAKRQKTLMSTKWAELDAVDLEDPIMVSEYVNEIFDHLREQELTCIPDPNYMLKQKDLQWKMRNILIDWLIEVHQKFKLLPETLFLTVNIIDRFLSRRAINPNKLQLVGITSMFIAAKYEEVFAPSINQFVYISDGSYTYDEIIKAERFILANLNFDLQYPNPLNFLRRISKADNYDNVTRTMGKYLMEISLLDESFISHPPSLIAASAMYVARHVRGSYEWDDVFEHYSGYKEVELETCVTKMISFLHKEAVYDSANKKYATEKNFCISTQVATWMDNCVEERNFDMPWI